MKVTLLILAAALTQATGGAAQDSWLPPPAIPALADQLIERLSAITPPKSRQGALADARTFVVQRVARVDALGLKGLVSNAPVLPGPALPDGRHAHLNAMARYQACNALLLTQFEAGPSVESRRVGALGLTAVTLAVLRFHEAFLAEGGTTQQIEAHLTSPAMGAALERLQSVVAVRARAEEACSAALVDLLR